MVAITKADLAEKLCDEVGLQRHDASELVDVFFEEIKKVLESGQELKISGFGCFNLRDKNERPGRNPKTGEDIPVSARRVVTFRASQCIKERLESNNTRVMADNEVDEDILEEVY